MITLLTLTPEPPPDLTSSPVLWAKVLQKAYADLTRGGPNFISAVVFFFGSPEVSHLETICSTSAMLEGARKKARGILKARRLTPEKVLAEQARIVRDIARGKFVFPPEKARKLRRELALSRRQPRRAAARVH